MQIKSIFYEKSWNDIELWKIIFANVQFETSNIKSYDDAVNANGIDGKYDVQSNETYNRSFDIFIV